MQGVANRLAGLHLAYLLQRAGLPVSAAGLQLPDAAPICKAGVAAGLAQELSLYRKCNSKQVFYFVQPLLHRFWHACPAKECSLKSGGNHVDCG